MKKISQLTWIIISLAGFVLFFTFLIILFVKQIIIDTPVYFFLIVVLGLIATGFLAGAMKSTAKYNATVGNKSLTIAGPAVIFLLILYVGFKYKPEPVLSPLTLSIQFLGPNGSNEIIQKGVTSIRIGEYQTSKNINEEGIATFTGISALYKGKKFDITLNTENYNLDTINENFALDLKNHHTNLTVKLILKKDSIFLKGRVIKLPEKLSISFAEVEFQGYDKVLVTDSSGRFSAKLPFKSGVETRVIVTKNNREIYNSLLTLTDKDFLSIPAY